MQHKINPGSIGFVMHHDNFISKIISKAMSSKWSHCFYVWGKCNETIVLAETTDYEVTKSTIEKYNKKSCSLEIWEPIPKHDSLKMAKDGQYLEGIVYGYLQLISLGVRRLLKKFSFKISNFFRQGAVCTAVPIAHSNKQPNISCLYNLDPESIDTEELHQLIKNSGEYRLVFKKEKDELWQD